jgi:hypothetical protein
LALTTRGKKVAGIAAGVAALGAGAFFLISNRAPGDPIGGALNPFDKPPATCPLTGEEPKNDAVLARPAVAVKIENNPAAYPLSGLDDADVVYEELVEGGITRFMAIFQCGSTTKAGPIRSARIVDPHIVLPYTQILGDAGGNPTVRQALEDAGVVSIDETHAGDAMMRVPRSGYASEHTLYANIDALRKLGKKEFSDPPPDDIFDFGEVPKGGKKARSVTVNFSPTEAAHFEWKDGRYYRSEGDNPLISEGGDQFATDNIIVEEHEVNFSATLGDVHGIRSTEIADVTGTGKAVLFRDGRAFVGKWTRASEDDPVTFTRKSGDKFVLHAGSTWIELLPNDQGDLKGSLEYGK